MFAAHATKLHKIKMSQSTHFNEKDQQTLYDVIAARRDMRHFLPNSQVDEDTFGRILAAGHRAPSVGLMQPWRFIRVVDATVRQQIQTLVELERLKTAQAMGVREDDFMQLKVEGVGQCAELLVVVQAPDDGTVFGRRTLPRETALCSTACAIQNMWLAARVENIGLGWVSIFDPVALAGVLHCPDGAQPIAILCIGPVEEFYDRPMLEQEGWRQGRPLADFLFTDTWGDR